MPSGGSNAPATSGPPVHKSGTVVLLSASLEAKTEERLSLSGFEEGGSRARERLVCSGCCRTFSGSTLQCWHCRMAYYCSPECQRGDWGSHKAGFSMDGSGVDRPLGKDTHLVVEAGSVPSSRMGK